MANECAVLIPENGIKSFCIGQNELIVGLRSDNVPMDDTMDDVVSYDNIRTSMKNDKLQGLIPKIERGDWKALERFISEIRLPLFSYLLRLGARDTELEDIAQETLIQIYQSLPRYDSTQPLIPWCFGIARNTLYKRWRGERRRKHYHEEAVRFLESELNLEGEAAAEELAHWQVLLQRCLDRLPVDQKKLIQLRYRDQRNSTEIAEMLQTSPDNVRQQLTRIRRALRQCIKRHDVEGGIV